MFDQLARLDEEHLLFLASMAVLVCLMVTAIAAVIAVQMRKLRERQLELGFKNDLLRRGVTVDEAVRLATSRRPTWSQSLMAFGDWTMLKLSYGWRNLVGAVPHIMQPLRRLLRIVSQEGRVWLRVLWRRGGQLCSAVWRETRPLLRWTMMSLSDCVHWIGDQTNRLVRRLAPNRS